MLIDHTQVHEQVRAEHVQLEVCALHIQTGRVAHLLEQSLGQGASAKNIRCPQDIRQLRRGLGQRHKPGPRLLRQAFQQCLNFVFEQTRHQPFATLFAHLIQYKQWHGHRDAITRITRFVQIGGIAVCATQPNGFGESLRGDACRFMPHQLFTAEYQQLRLALHFIAIPSFKQSPRTHIRWNLLIVKSIDQLIVHQNVLASRLVL